MYPTTSTASNKSSVLCPTHTNVRMTSSAYGGLCGNIFYEVSNRGVATGGISVYLKFFMWLFCLLDPGQIRYRAIYTHPNQIPGYASGVKIIWSSFFQLRRFYGFATASICWPKMMWPSAAAVTRPCVLDFDVLWLFELQACTGQTTDGQTQYRLQTIQCIM